MMKKILFFVCYFASQTTFGNFNQTFTADENYYERKEILENEQRPMQEISPAYNNSGYMQLFGQTLQTPTTSETTAPIDEPIEYFDDELQQDDALPLPPAETDTGTEDFPFNEELPPEDDCEYYGDCEYYE